MPTVKRSALVPFSAEKMFDLVNDVASYPQFLPGCADSRILEVSTTQMRASLQISKAGVQQWFTTENHLARGQHILMTLVDGPFSQLVGGWTFKGLTEDACKIELDLTFEFSSKLVEVAFGKAFSMIANNMVKVFSERAKEVYGE